MILTNFICLPFSFRDFESLDISLFYELNPRVIDYFSGS